MPECVCVRHNPTQVRAFTGHNARVCVCLRLLHEPRDRDFTETDPEIYREIERDRPRDIQTSLHRPTDKQTLLHSPRQTLLHRPKAYTLHCTERARDRPTLLHRPRDRERLRQTQRHPLYCTTQRQTLLQSEKETERQRERACHTSHRRQKAHNQQSDNVFPKHPVLFFYWPADSEMKSPHRQGPTELLRSWFA